MDATEYGARLKECRLGLGLSQAAFAEKVGVSKATQVNYEAGRTIPDLSYADRCAALGIDPGRLLMTRGVKKLDLVDAPIELHRIVESCAQSARAGQSTEAAYRALWQLLLSVAGTRAT